MFKFETILYNFVHMYSTKDVMQCNAAQIIRRDGKPERCSSGRLGPMKSSENQEILRIFGGGEGVGRETGAAMRLVT